MATQAAEVIEHQEPAPQTLPTVAQTVTPMTMLAQAIDRGMTPDVIDKLMGLQDRWDKTQARKAFDVAIARAKAEIPVIVKSATGHNDKKYANFAAIARAVDPIISKHGISYRFRTVQTEKAISVTCVLSHEAGHYEETTLSGPADTTGSKNSIQAIGSTLTYLQRYSLVQALGLAAAEDDDGKAAGFGEKVSEQQIEAIRSAIVDVAADIPKFCRFMKVEKIEDIPAKRFPDAMAALAAKRVKS